MGFFFNIGSTLSIVQKRKLELLSNAKSILSFLLINLTVLLFLISALAAQVTIQEFPRDHQLYQRDLSTNVATVIIQGTIAQAEQYSSLSLRIYRPSGIFQQESRTLRFRNSRASFYFFVKLPAELSNFRIELYGLRNGQEVLLKKAEKVVAGDVILINGQSNAEALAASMPVDYDEFARAYTPNAGWDYMQYSFPGRWGARLAKNIVTQQGVPVAIFNQAEGGKDIAYFLRQEDNPSQGNYGRLKQRLMDAGITKVTAIAWFQGEGDGWSTSIADYKARFNSLHQAWKQDYRPDFTYIFQIRFRSCGHNQPYPFEAQRQSAIELSEVGIISSTNLEHDGCHFPYENGYRELGNNLFHLMRRDIYGIDSGNVEAPNISKATQVSPTELVLDFNNTSSLSEVGNPWADFKLEGSTVRINNGLVEGNQIRLFLSAPITDIEGISYLAHSGSAKDWLVNPKGLGLLQFYNYGISLASTEVADTIPPISNVNTENTINCNRLLVQTGPNILAVSGMVAPNIIVQIFDKNWASIYSCIGSCESSTKILDNLDAGRYFVKIQLLSASWELECLLEDTYVVVGNTTTNNDECDQIQIGTTQGAISVNGLKGAPVASVLVLSIDRNYKYFNCWGNDCGAADATTIPIDAGSYRVIVKYYTTAFQELCQKEQIVSVGSNLKGASVSSKTGATNYIAPIMEVYPTVTREKVDIYIPKQEQQVTHIEIWSQYGQIVQTHKIDNFQPKTEIYIKNLAKGIYFLNAPLNDGTNLTRKIIIN